MLQQLKMICTLFNEYLYKKVGPRQDLLISFAAAYNDIHWINTHNIYLYNIYLKKQNYYHKAYDSYATYAFLFIISFNFSKLICHIWKSFLSVFSEALSWMGSGSLSRDGLLLLFRVAVVNCWVCSRSITTYALKHFEYLSTCTICLYIIYLLYHTYTYVLVLLLIYFTYIYIL